ncbi:hypothetical protein ABNQ39_20405 [Azospirillum sp. A26]|uniref:hypothetical protein n=1 Tax=Azospirillum sp. A26 TaxID=3160607 RepID=UPI00366DE224
MKFPQKSFLQARIYANIAWRYDVETCFEKRFPRDEALAQAMWKAVDDANPNKRKYGRSDFVTHQD